MRSNAYESCLNAISAEHTPWYVVPADDKKNARLIISEIILDTFKSFNMSYPEVGSVRLQELASIRQQLLLEAPCPKP